MDNAMANFISLHMLNDGYVEGEDQPPEQAEGGLTYQCPKSGSHFEFMDLLGRMRTLKQKRKVIDEQIRQEDERQKKVRELASKQKQQIKQQKIRNKVSNILKSAQ